jgi:hypothetical protein
MHEKSFWRRIPANDYAIPQGETLSDLTAELLSYLGSPDPELRDELALPILSFWLHRGLYSPDQLRDMITQLTTNLRAGLGEAEGDSAFLRSFSALFLAEMVNYDNKHPFLEKSEVLDLLNKALVYLSAENDMRGYEPTKGWVHPTAHTADLLMVLACNRHLGAPELKKILEGIASKLIHADTGIYLYNEDERLVMAVIAVLRRNLLGLDFLENWLNGFVHPEGTNWKDAHLSEQGQRAFYNVKTFLRSFYILLDKIENPPATKNEVSAILKRVLGDLTPQYE